MLKHIIMIFLSLFSIGFSSIMLGRELVSASTIKAQKDQTIDFSLSNGMPVTYRKVPDSDVFWISLSFSKGSSTVSPEQSVILNSMAQLISRGSQAYPKEKLYALLEKYGTGVACSFGVENGMCQMSFVGQYIEELVPIFKSLITDPVFESKEVDIVLDLSRASNLAANQNPESYVNEVVNHIFYGDKHPYWRSNEFGRSVLQKSGRKEITALYKKIMSESSKRIIVVGALAEEQVKKILEDNFKDLNPGKREIFQANPPQFDPAKNLSIADRDVPTAYLRAKFVTPGALHQDFIKSSLMIHILSEELETEIRTRRSLSYAVYASQLAYSVGVGILHASTSKPKETLESMALVIKKLQTDLIPASELERYKTVFATGYFLNLEDHGSLGSSLASTYHYHGGSQKLYGFPVDLAEVSAEDIRDVARRYLKQFRLGVVYKKSEFDPATAQKFLKEFL